MRELSFEGINTVFFFFLDYSSHKVSYKRTILGPSNTFSFLSHYGSELILSIEVYTS